MDLFGDMVNGNSPITPETSGSLPSSTRMLLHWEDDDMVTAGRRGLIVWGGAVRERELGGDTGVPQEMGMSVEGLRGVDRNKQSLEGIRGEDAVMLAN
jgi:hypothetical protein